jgi:hypothetical protein
VHKKNLFTFNKMMGVANCCVASLILFQLHTGCNSSKESTSEYTIQESVAVDDSSTAATDPTANEQGVIEGKVVETMDAGRYTYILVQTSTDKVWAAGPAAEIQIGEKVILSAGIFMKDFKSETLDRKFEKIYFVPSFGGQSTDSINPHEMMTRAHQDRDVTSDQKDAKHDGSGISTSGGTPVVPREDVGNFVKAPGGLTVAEIYSRKSELAGQKVIVRGKVVKFTPAIMKTNWLHLQDGTGLDGFHDLTVTTNATVSVGDLITIRGVLAVDKNFGAGYRYDVIIERGELIDE